MYLSNDAELREMETNHCDNVYGQDILLISNQMLPKMIVKVKIKSYQLNFMLYFFKFWKI